MLGGLSKLIRLGDSSWTLKKADDIRRRRVIDDAGDEQGVIQELFIDEAETRVRLLQVSPPGIFGVSRCAWFISTEAITSVTFDSVRLNLNGQDPSGALTYDPDVVEHVSRYQDLLYDYRCF